MASVPPRVDTKRRRYELERLLSRQQPFQRVVAPHGASPRARPSAKTKVCGIYGREQPTLNRPQRLNGAGEGEGPGRVSALRFPFFSLLQHGDDLPNDDPVKTAEKEDEKEEEENDPRGLAGAALFAHLLTLDEPDPAPIRVSRRWTLVTVSLASRYHFSVPLLA